VKFKSWLTENTTPEAANNILRTFFGEHDVSVLPILADSLEEVGNPLATAIRLVAEKPRDEWTRPEVIQYYQICRRNARNFKRKIGNANGINDFIFYVAIHDGEVKTLKGNASFKYNVGTLMFGNDRLSSIYTKWMDGGWIRPRPMTFLDLSEEDERMLDAMQKDGVEIRVHGFARSTMSGELTNPESVTENVSHHLNYSRPLYIHEVPIQALWSGLSQILMAYVKK
jgi:hypothetical protein